MTVLPAGSFRVSDYRKAIPDWVKVFAGMRYLKEGRPPELKWVILTPEEVQDLQYDHRPPLQDRPYDTEKGDFDPPQHDPHSIFAVQKRKHGERTFGRKADAEKTVTTRGSDIGEARHIRKVRDSESMHRARMAAKAGDPQALAEALGCVKQKSRLRPKRQIPGRPFPKRQRPLRRSA